MSGPIFSINAGAVRQPDGKISLVFIDVPIDEKESSPESIEKVKKLVEKEFQSRATSLVSQAAPIEEFRKIHLITPEVETAILDARIGEAEESSTFDTLIDKFLPNPELSFAERLEMFKDGIASLEGSPKTHLIETLKRVNPDLDVASLSSLQTTCKPEELIEMIKGALYTKGIEELNKALSNPKSLYDLNSLNFSNFVKILHVVSSELLPEELVKEKHKQAFINAILQFTRENATSTKTDIKLFNEAFDECLKLNLFKNPEISTFLRSEKGSIQAEIFGRLTESQTLTDLEIAVYTDLDFETNAHIDIEEKVKEGFEKCMLFHIAKRICDQYRSTHEEAKDIIDDGTILKYATSKGKYSGVGRVGEKKTEEELLAEFFPLKTKEEVIEEIYNTVKSDPIFQSGDIISLVPTLAGIQDKITLEDELPDEFKSKFLEAIFKTHLLLELRENYKDAPNLAEAVNEAMGNVFAKDLFNNPNIQSICWRAFTCEYTNSRTTTNFIIPIPTFPSSLFNIAKFTTKPLEDIPDHIAPQDAKAPARILEDIKLKLKNNSTLMSLLSSLYKEPINTLATTSMVPSTVTESVKLHNEQMTKVHQNAMTFYFRENAKERNLKQKVDKHYENKMREVNSSIEAIKIDSTLSDEEKTDLIKDLENDKLVLENFRLPYLLHAQTQCEFQSILFSYLAHDTNIDKTPTNNSFDLNYLVKVYQERPNDNTLLSTVLPYHVDGKWHNKPLGEYVTQINIYNGTYSDKKIAKTTEEECCIHRDLNEVRSERRLKMLYPSYDDDQEISNNERYAFLLTYFKLTPEKAEERIKEYYELYFTDLNPIFTDIDTSTLSLKEKNELLLIFDFIGEIELGVLKDLERGIAIINDKIVGQKIVPINLVRDEIKKVFHLFKDVKFEGKTESEEHFARLKKTLETCCGFFQATFATTEAQTSTNVKIAPFIFNEEISKYYQLSMVKGEPTILLKRKFLIKPQSLINKFQSNYPLFAQDYYPRAWQENGFEVTLLLKPLANNKKGEVIYKYRPITSINKCCSDFIKKDLNVLTLGNKAGTAQLPYEFHEYPEDL